MKRYAITHLQKDGLRALAVANQGRNHYDTKELADKALDRLRSSLSEKLGYRALEVREIECYEHGDAIGIYSDTDFHIVTGRPFTTICCSCGKIMRAGDGGEAYADVTGTPWQAYYCTPCASPTLALQEVTRHE